MAASKKKKEQFFFLATSVVFVFLFHVFVSSNCRTIGGLLKTLTLRPLLIFIGPATEQPIGRWRGSLYTAVSVFTEVEDVAQTCGRVIRRWDTGHRQHSDMVSYYRNHNWIRTNRPRLRLLPLVPINRGLSVWQCTLTKSLPNHPTHIRTSAILSLTARLRISVS